MKRRDLLKILEDMGCQLSRLVVTMIGTNEETKQSQPTPRHWEINEFLAKSIIKKLKSKFVYAESQNQPR